LTPSKTGQGWLADTIRDGQAENWSRVTSFRNGLFQRLIHKKAIPKCNRLAGESYSKMQPTRRHGQFSMHVIAVDNSYCRFARQNEAARAADAAAWVRSAAVVFTIR
jgi:hypothetical protein